MSKDQLGISYLKEVVKREILIAETLNKHETVSLPIDVAVALVGLAEYADVLQKQLDAKIMFVNKGDEQDRYALQQQNKRYRDALLQIVNIDGHFQDDNWNAEIAHQMIDHIAVSTLEESE